MDAFSYAHSRDDVVWMSQNTNHLPTHPKVNQVLKTAVDQEVYRGYCKVGGEPALKQLILEDLGLPDHQVMLTHGATEGLYLLLRYIFKDGGQMITSDPSYVTIHKFAELSGASSTNIPIYGGNCRYPIEAIKKAINEETKAILLIDPLNPLGSTYPQDEVKAICDLAKAHDLWLINDVTYRDFAPDHTLATDFYPEKTIVAYSVSKNCALAGMRIGALVGPEPLMAKLCPYVVSELGVNILAQHAAIAALETKPLWIKQMCQTMMSNQTMIKQTVDQVSGAFLPVFPSYANMFVIDLAETKLCPDKIQHQLLYEHQVFVRSGQYVSPGFGHQFLRLSFSVEPEGIERFSKAFLEVMAEMKEAAL